MQQQINLYNLLPKKTVSKLTRKNVLLSYGAFLLLLFIFHFILIWQKHTLVNHLATLKNEVTLHQQQLTLLMQEYPVSETDSLKKMILQLQEEYASKAGLIDLLSPYANFSAYLTGLGNAIVTGVWLTEIHFDRGETKIFLKGYTLDPALLEQFHHQLTMQPIFSNLSFELIGIKQAKFPASFIMTAKKVNKA